MQRNAVKIDAATVMRATTLANGWKRDTLKTAEKLKVDAERDKRVAEQLCETCYYLRKGGLAGQAITTQPCGICAAPQTYSSTATHVLCLSCAVSNELCKRCGADFDLKPNRIFKRHEDSADAQR